MKYLLLTMRPHQWAKNLLVFGPLLFAQMLLEPSALAKSTLCFFLFCFLAGSIYILNDIVDVEKDKLHPKKKKRPIASGDLPLSLAKKAWPLIAVASLLGCLLPFDTWRVRLTLLGILSAYFVINLAYSFYLKNIAYLDVLIIANGFLLRVLAGIVVINVVISTWILPCTFLLALFLALGKRRHELASYEENATKQRKSLSHYSLPQLDLLLAIVSSLTILSYCAYTLDKYTIKRFQTHYLIYTIPFVVFGFVRFLQLMVKGISSESPTQELLRDIPSLLNVICWVAAVTYVVYAKPGKNFFIQ